MVRAAAAGAIDFARADPRDKWWWRKLRWITEEIENTAFQQAYEAQHRHWVTVFSNSALKEESFNDSQSQAQEALGSFLAALLPWQAENFRKAAQAGSSDELLAEFRELYGYPGDPRYEEMLAETMAAFKRLEDGDYDEDDEDY